MGKNFEDKRVNFALQKNDQRYQYEIFTACSFLWKPAKYELPSNWAGHVYFRVTAFKFGGISFLAMLEKC